MKFKRGGLLLVFVLSLVIFISSVSAVCQGTRISYSGSCMGTTSTYDEYCQKVYYPDDCRTNLYFDPSYTGPDGYGMIVGGKYYWVWENDYRYWGGLGYGFSDTQYNPYTVHAQCSWSANAARYTSCGDLDENTCLSYQSVGICSWDDSGSSYNQCIPLASDEVFCNDGIDNDCDGKIDMDDVDCICAAEVDATSCTVCTEDWQCGSGLCAQTNNPSVSRCTLSECHILSNPVDYPEGMETPITTCLRDSDDCAPMPYYSPVNICSNGILSTCFGYGWSQTTCEYGCWGTESCLIKKSNCDTCLSNSQCLSGICVQALGSSTKRCVESTNCAIDASSSCERALGYQNCLGTSSLVTCSSNNLWSITSCPYGCSGTSSGPSCNAAPTPVLEWRTDIGYPISSSLQSPVEAELPYILLLSVTNPQSTTGTMSIYEYNANTGSTIATTESNLPAFLNEGKMYYMWTIDNSKYDSFAGSGEVYQFKFTYSGISAPSNSLYFEKTSTHCDNGIMDEDEEGDDCGGSLCVECTVEQFCNNNVMDNGEEGIDCGGLCTACPVEKEARWSPVGPYTFDWESIYEGGNNFSMILSNADDATEPFSIFRKRTWPASDIELSSTTGEISGTDLIGEWLMSKESFPETSGTYNFYFRVDGERSPDLEITIEGDRPICGDGVCDAYAGEDSTSCLEDCEFICFGVTTCSDYGSDQNACSNNVCGISSVGGDSCFFDTDLGICAGERVNRFYNGQDIGSCFYTENMNEDTCDYDGMLTYSWTTLWQWATTNTRDVPTSGDCSELGDGYIFDIDTNYCHYDPEYAKNECMGDNGGSTTIPCSAQIQLNFFTLNNLIAAILIVVIAYIILNYARKVKSSKKVIPVTKPISKKPATKASKKSVKKTAKKKVVKKK